MQLVTAIAVTKAFYDRKNGHFVNCVTKLG